MAFSLPRRLKPLTGPLDMTPLLNVVLLLLIFFLLSSSFVLQPGIKIDPPHVGFEGGSPSSRLVVAITMTSQEDASGNPLPRLPIIYFEDQVLTLDGLRDALDHLPQERNGPPVVLKADKDVPLDLVAQVIDLAFAHRRAIVIATATSTSSP